MSVTFHETKNYRKRNGVRRAGAATLLLCGAWLLHFSQAQTGREKLAVAKTPAPVLAQRYVARKLCDLSDRQIDESSGLGASRRFPGLLWTHNDSGDAARLFLIDLRGNTRAIVSLNGATAHDWEDMAVGADAMSGSGTEARVYVGDIGDNAAKRDDVTIYSFRESQIELARNVSTTQTLAVDCEQMTLHYPDGARDAETLMATPQGQLLVVAKSHEGNLVYVTPRGFSSGATQTLIRVGRVNFATDDFFGKMATGGDISADGSHVVVRSYSLACEWPRPKGASWSAVFAAKPLFWELPQTAQGEAICYSADGRNLFTSSEKTPAPLWLLEGKGR